MHDKFTRFPIILIASLALTGCQSSVNNIPVSRNSKTGQAIARMDESEKLYNARVSAYRKAMMDYENAKGGKRGTIFYSSLSTPTQVVSPNVVICKLQGAYSVDEHVNYNVKITYEDETHLIVKNVEILEKLAQ